MASITNEPKRKGPIVTKVRGMFEHRAEWLYLILDEARKKGLKRARRTSPRGSFP